jgi:hypothetical protein
MNLSSQLRPICLPFILVIAAILCFGGLQFERGRSPYLSERSTNDPTHFYDDIAAALADSSAQRR